MRLRELLGWPPGDFQCTENPSVPLDDRRPEVLRIDSAEYVGGHPGLKSPGDIVLTLVDEERSEVCTARWKIQDGEAVRRIQSTLIQCKGLTLAEAGQREVPEDGGGMSHSP